MQPEADHIDAWHKNTYSVANLNVPDKFILSSISGEVMKNGTCTVKTSATMQLVDITSTLSHDITQSAVESGICVIFNPHTTAGVTINEGADPDVKSDIIAGLRNMVPLDYPFKHAEGNSPAHIMASLMGSSVTVVIEKGRFRLGTWQKIFFCEFDGPRTRSIHWNIV